MIVLTLSIYAANQYLLDINTQIYPSECLLLASVLCATDTIAVLTLIHEDKYKTLNAVLFGEGVVNDAVSILLYRSIYSTITNGANLPDQQMSITSTEIFRMLLGFITLSISSIFLGITFGLLSALLLK